MKAIEFNEVNLRIAENQDEYQTLPVHKHGDDVGTVTACFELDDGEIEQVKSYGTIWLSFLTFGRSFQPVGMSCLSPFGVDGYECPHKPEHLCAMRNPCVECAHFKNAISGGRVVAVK